MKPKLNAENLERVDLGERQQLRYIGSSLQEKLEVQPQPEPAFSIFKVLSSQDCPMNCRRQETSQVTCFSSKAGLHIKDLNVLQECEKHFCMATGQRRRL